MISLVPGQNLTFLVFSNEQLEASAFDGLPVVLSDNSAVVDLALMGRCQYLMGPPSTFSAWASFYSQVPLCFLKNAGPDINLDDFVVAKG
jgi:hypothetical protein